MKCNKCGTEVETFSPMRKWCYECRRQVSSQQAKARKILRRDSHETPISLVAQ